MALQTSNMSPNWPCNDYFFLKNYENTQTAVGVGALTNFMFGFKHPPASLRDKSCQGLQRPISSDGHSGAVHQRALPAALFFGSGSAAAFFLSPATSGSAAVFLAEKAAAPQRCFLSKFSPAAATANKLLPKLFQFTFSLVTVWSLYSPLVFTLLLLPRYFSLVEHTRPL